MSTALLARSATPDRAFERLYRRHVHDVYRYVLAVLRNQADAEDATQATFLSAYRAFIRGEEPLKPRNWLLKIAHNECRQRFRAASRRPTEVAWDDERGAAPGVDETVPTADEIRSALAHLSFNQRAALVMRELEGRSYAEIGDVLDVSVSAVETLLFRARRALREQLEGGLSCGEAELALSKRADGQLSFAERGPLRAHLRECADCAALERGLRFRRRAIKSLGVVPLPSSLGSFFGGGAATSAGVGVGAKAAAVVVAGVLGSGVAGDGVKKPRDVSVEPAAAATVRPGPATERSAVRLQGVSSQASWRSSMSPRPRPARRSIEAAPSVAPAAAAGAAAAAPPVDAAEPGLTEPTPNAPEPRTAPETRVEVPAVPNVPVPASQPAIPPPAPAAPIPPERPELPTLPAQPALPELPKPELPQLPELPKPDLPGVPGLPPLNTPAT